MCPIATNSAYTNLVFVLKIFSILNSLIYHQHIPLSISLSLSKKSSWLHFIYGDREQALHNLNLPDYSNNAQNYHKHDKKYQQLFKFMKDNENSLREGGRQDPELPLSLRICSASEHNNNLKEPKSPANENEASQEDPSFQNTNFVSVSSTILS